MRKKKRKKYEGGKLKEERSKLRGGALFGSAGKKELTFRMNYPRA